MCGSGGGDVEEDPNESTLSRYCRIASYVVVWLLFSGGLILYNK
jgi:hypothetical protein